VYQIALDTALVQTVDFFTPIVDDPYTFGQIAAVNSLSDVYAMGGRPLSSLALVCFPEKGDLDVLERILAGGLSKMVEASCTVIGGHSIRDEEIKFGYSVTGTIHPQRVLANRSAQPGDALLLTKALGTGVISTAIKRGKAEPAWIDAAVLSMTTLNKAAAEAILGTTTALSSRASGAAFAPRVEGALSSDTPPPFAVHALTDITGFGLIGHAREMALASGVSLCLRASAVPLLTGALECVRGGYIPGGLKANREFAECLVGYEDGIADDVRTMLYDPQTAGGLLISVAPEDAEDLQRSLAAAGVAAARIGEVLTSAKPLIEVKRGK
jgi:selenide,water dikinase